MSPLAPTIQIGLSLDDLVLLAFYILVGLYALFTAILYYHWQVYSPDVRMNFITFVTYFVITVPLILTLGTVVAIF